MPSTRAITVVRSAVEEFGRNNGTVLAAAIAYYTLLSIFPLILGLIAILGIFFTDPSVREQFVASVADLFPGSQPLIRETVDQVVAGRGTAGIVATVGLIWGGSGVFGGITQAMNRIWHVEQLPNPVVSTIRAVALVPAVGVVFLVSLLLTTALRVAEELGVRVFGTSLESIPLLLPLLGLALPIVITFLIFCLIYGVIPNRALSWSDVWPGALLSSILFEIGKQVFAWYLSTFAHFNAVYGSIGAVIGLVTWAFYAAIVLLIGAQLNAVLGGVTETPANAQPTPSRKPASRQPSRRAP